MPVSSIEMASPWALPTVGRGFMHDLLVDRLQVAGRRPGLLLGWRGKGDWRPQVAAGAFQGSVMTSESTIDVDVDLIERQTLYGQTLVVRGGVESEHLEVGAYYQYRVGTPSLLATDRYWTAGGDLTGDWTFSSGGLRVWLDGLAGASWIEHPAKAPDGADAVFVAARGLIAYRFGGTEGGAPYLEPYVLAGALEPDLDVTYDLFWEIAPGVAVGFWQRARLTLQAEIDRADRSFPARYVVARNPDRTALLLQAGLAF